MAALIHDDVRFGNLQLGIDEILIEYIQIAIQVILGRVDRVTLYILLMHLIIELVLQLEVLRVHRAHHVGVHRRVVLVLVRVRFHFFFVVECVRCWLFE